MLAKGTEERKKEQHKEVGQREILVEGKKKKPGYLVKKNRAK